MTLSQSQYKYLYLGLIDISSEHAVIIDPYINDISVLSEKIPPSSFRSQRVSRVKNGSYACYSLLNPNGTARYLLALHAEFDVNDVGDMVFEDAGSVSISFGNAVCICDEDRLYRTSDYGSTLSFYDEALFSAAQLQLILANSTSDCDNSCRHRLLELLRMSSSGYISGKEIKCTFPEHDIWRGFYQFDENCTLWSCEILHRIRSAPSKASVLPGCVAAISHPAVSDHSNCWLSKNRKHQTTAFIVELL